MMLDLFNCLDCPPIFSKSEVNFWNDEHISKQMLKYHLDPEFEGASRKLSFITESVHWLKGIVPSGEYTRLLDMGCGPGLYAERFSKAGYEVTGMDFSKRSIEYAKSSAFKQGLNIDYIYENYLKMNFNNAFDFVTFIYCDYGALSEKDRFTVLRKIYHSLRPGGKFVFDVFSMAEFNKFLESETWNVCPAGGFWSPEKYLALERRKKYQDNVTLEQTVVLTEDSIRNYRIWNCFFSPERLRKEAKEAGFKVLDIFGDMTGAPFTSDGSVFTMLLEKKV